MGGGPKGTRMTNEEAQESVRPSNLSKGRMRTKKIGQGPNKGDTVKFKGSPSGKPYPVRVLKDVGKPSTLRDNSGVKFGKKGK